MGVTHCFGPGQAEAHQGPLGDAAPLARMLEEAAYEVVPP